MHSTSASIKIFTIELLEGNVPGNDNEIKVMDKRKFDKEGNIKEKNADAGRKGKSKTVAESSEQKQPTSDRTETRPKKNFEKLRENKGEQQTVDFIPFIISLYTSILASLGELSDPSGIKIEKNITQAKELIDIIKMLRNKTKGNLSKDEQNVIDEIVYQSEMIYVKNASGLKL